MKDVSIVLTNRPGALAEMGEALGRAGVSLEGGGAFVVGGTGVAHFLFKDGDAAGQVLERAGIRVLAVKDVVILRLRQSEPGQLGEIARRMSDSGVNIEVQYSDHENSLEPRERRVPALRDPFEVAVRDVELLSLELPSALASSPRAAHEARALQHPQMLRDRLPRERRPSRESRDRLGPVSGQAGHQPEPGRIAQRVEDRGRSLDVVPRALRPHAFSRT